MNPATIEPTFEVHLDPDWAHRALVDDVRRGFSRRPLRLPPRWLYDDRGSELFDRITRLDEYYATEAERSILRREADHLAALTGADTIIERTRRTRCCAPSNARGSSAGSYRSTSASRPFGMLRHS
jgi:L-histidine Nalpha-methyltransferase